MHFKLVVDIRTNDKNPELLDCAIKRVGTVPKKYGALALAVHFAVAEGVRTAMNPKTKAGDTNGEASKK